MILSSTCWSAWARALVFGREVGATSLGEGELPFDRLEQVAHLSDRKRSWQTALVSLLGQAAEAVPPTAAVTRDRKASTVAEFVHARRAPWSHHCDQVKVGALDRTLPWRSPNERSQWSSSSRQGMDQSYGTSGVGDPRRSRPPAQGSTPRGSELLELGIRYAGIP